MRLVFFGTPTDAATALDALVADGQEIALVVTRPDTRRGRGGSPSPSPVRIEAERHGIDVRTPVKAAEVLDDISRSGADLGVVVAYGQILAPSVIEAFPLGLINVHFSLLPRWRGAAPVERAVLAGDDETGVCIMGLEQGLDTGPVFATARTPIDPNETAGELRSRLVDLGADLLVRTLPEVSTANPEPQHGEPTYADKLDVAEFQLDMSRTTRELHRIVRAGNPRPGAWMVVDGTRVKVLRATPTTSIGAPVGSIDESVNLSTIDGALMLEEVQPAGRRAMPGVEWRRGLRSPDVSLDPQ
ncbi:MAG: methionyl-tRNA formyltransferase [Acidimicrobiia bacterium]|nr:methionyl-tRNA formyltransferase [Acidimicrobiia bacterium]